ncbi:YeeE/YedE family protein [uncultured Cohaesibacter sp.]|uniref:YeeE/YedE family protein n=1 Tax=uncultured Cohaesibacter sp. TaxID=1002546 RepID=UPI0029C80B66|nr:YeeE/YedE family protein [uncultured Cohaesibacter sp.]
MADSVTDISTTLEAPAKGSRLFARTGLIGLTLVAILALMAAAGVRYGLLLAIGVGFGLTLEGLRFGFAGPWRAMILRREPAGLIAQLLAIGLVAIVTFPLLSGDHPELIGAHAAVGWSMVGGAFVFGAAMQLLLGCGSGTLVNAGSGNPVSVVALPFFVVGAFAGSYHLLWWTDLGHLPLVVLEGSRGLVITLLGLLIVGLGAFSLAPRQARFVPRRLLVAAVLLAALAIANFAVAGQPWGVVYGLGLWAAKGASALGADLTASSYWASPVHQERLAASLLTDYTSLTNLGIILGAFIVAVWRSGLSTRLPSLPARAWLATVIAGFLLGYSSRLALGCNVGAFFSGISTGSLHGWVWFVAAFAGAWVGIRLRKPLGLEG